MYRINLKLMPLIMIFLVTFSIIQLYVMTSQFSLLQDPYLYVYEHSINAVITKGSIYVLYEIFDNFASSPGTILLGSFLSLALGMNILYTMYIGGLAIYILIFLLVLLLLRNLDNNRFDYKAGLMAIFSAGYTALYDPILAYGSIAYIILLTVLSLIFKIYRKDVLKVEYVIVLVILIVSMNLHYLPMGLFLLTIISLLVIILIISRIKLGCIKSVLLISLIIVSAYYVYMGQFFFGDFNAFIYTITNIRLEQRFYIQRTVVSRLSYDPLYSILYSISLLRFSLALIIIFYLFLILLIKRKILSSNFVLAFGLLGAFLYFVGFVPYVFVSLSSDYGLRIFVLSYAIYATTVYVILTTDKHNTGGGLFGLFNLSSILRFLIFLLAMISLIGSIFTPLARIYHDIRGFNLSSQYNYGQEGLWVSTFIKDFVHKSLPKDIISTYRYIYLYSRYGIYHQILGLHINIDIKSVIDNRNTLMIIPLAITRKADVFYGPISYDDFQELILYKNIFLNSGLTIILQ